MKTTTALGIALLIYTSVNAQENLSKQSESYLENLGKKTVRVLEEVVKQGFDYADDKIKNATLENEIEQKISYTIPDNKAANLVSYLGLKQGKTAYITNKSKDKVAAKVYFRYDLDDIAFAQNYEFSLNKNNNSIDKITSKGNSWIDIKGKGYSMEDGIKIIHLYDEIIRDWDSKKVKHEKNNQSEKFVYDKKSIDVNRNDALVEIEYYIVDKFGNKKDERTNEITLEYKFKDDKWQFSDNNSFSSKKHAIQNQKGILQQIEDGAKLGYDKLQKLWRGE